jgi:hypothetical protein
MYSWKNVLLRQQAESLVYRLQGELSRTLHLDACVLRARTPHMPQMSNVEVNIRTVRTYRYPIPVEIRIPYAHS